MILLSFAFCSCSKAFDVDTSAKEGSVHILGAVIDNEDGDLDEDTVMMDAMDCGADDFEADGDAFTVYTTPDDFNAVADAMTAKKYSFVSAQIEMVPPNYVKLSPEDAERMEKMLELFDDDDDVQNTWHNWDED